MRIEVDGVYDFEDRGENEYGDRIYAGWLTPNHTDKEGQNQGVELRFSLNRDPKVTFFTVLFWEQGKFRGSISPACFDYYLDLPEMEVVLKSYISNFKKMEGQGIYGFLDNRDLSNGIRFHSIVPLPEYSGWLTPNYYDEEGRLHGDRFFVALIPEEETSFLSIKTYEHGKITKNRSVATINRIVDPSEIGDILREYELIKTPKQDKPPRASGGRKL